MFETVLPRVKEIMFPKFDELVVILCLIQVMIDFGDGEIVLRYDTGRTHTRPH